MRIVRNSIKLNSIPVENVNVGCFVVTWLFLERGEFYSSPTMGLVLNWK